MQDSERWSLRHFWGMKTNVISEEVMRGTRLGCQALHRRISSKLPESVPKGCPSKSFHWCLQAFTTFLTILSCLQILQSMPASAVSVSVIMCKLYNACVGGCIRAIITKMVGSLMNLHQNHRRPHKCPYPAHWA